MKKVLILTAGFGDGHNAAARNLRDALEHLCDEVKVEVLDLFADTCGPLNTLAQKAYRGLVQFAPTVWGSVYACLDASPALGNRLGAFARLKNALADILHETQPDCVVSTYPAYGHAIAELYRDHAERGFRFLTVVTDSITVNAAWYRASADFFCVPNAETAVALRQAGVPDGRIKTFGFPVSPIFADGPPVPLPSPAEHTPRKILYLINTGKKKAGKAINGLLEIPDVHLTITVGRDAELKAKLIKRTGWAAERVQVLGWTNEMPKLMMSHHLVITKAGGATVQEAIAARCPIIANQVIPGQEVGNARLIQALNIGAVEAGNRAVAETVEKAFAHQARLWQLWRKNLSAASRPDASVRLAEFILAECEGSDPSRKKLPLFSDGSPQRNQAAAENTSSGPGMLLCDFHVHSNYSDGKLTVPELVDFYGGHGFDCLCITDHLADPRRLIGKLSRLSNLTLAPNQLEEYFDVIARERRRAWRKYGMLLMAGIEFNKDGYTRKTSAHLLGIDLKEAVDPALDLPETISRIHAQGALAVASHPHIMKSQWGRNTLYLWENQERFAPLIDAWEIANRNDIFNPIGLKRLPFIASSDLHKPKHIYSWKTVLYCDKNSESIKECIRRNEHVSITLYRDHSGTAIETETNRVTPHALPAVPMAVYAALPGATRAARGL